MSDPTVKAGAKERTLLGITSLNFLGENGDFPDVLKSSLSDIRDWVNRSLPTDFDQEGLMANVLRIRKEAGIVDDVKQKS